MRDSEDIINSLTAYLTETVGGKSRINNAIDSINSEKGDNLLPNISDTVILGQRLQEVNTFKNGWLNIDIMGEARAISTYDESAKNYIVEISYIVRDDFSSNVFLRALRMESVIFSLMKDYFRDNQEAGFISGEIESSFTPERVLLGNEGFRGIKSGIVYSFLVY